MVNDHFTLVFIINSGFLVLVPENSYLAFNIPYTSPKTDRVYFGVLQSSVGSESAPHFYKSPFRSWVRALMEAKEKGSWNLP